MERTCIVCGKKMKIHLFKNHSYNNGYYFGVVEIPVGKGKYKKITTAREDKKEFDVAEWTGKKKRIEYWECVKCYNEK